MKIFRVILRVCEKMRTHFEGVCENSACSAENFLLGGGEIYPVSDLRVKKFIILMRALTIFAVRMEKSRRKPASRIGLFNGFLLF